MAQKSQVQAYKYLSNKAILWGEKKSLFLNCLHRVGMANMGARSGVENDLALPYH